MNKIRINKKENTPENWKCLKTEYGPDLILFKVRYDWMKNPRNDCEMKRLVLESGDWVNIIAITRDEKVICVRQFRFGTQTVTTEIPGGMVDPGEDSLQAAQRELQEETGYTSTQWEYLGCVEPNPAFHNNLCHHWMARDVEKTKDTNLDAGEDIIVVKLSVNAIRKGIRDGTLRHSLVLSRLFKGF